MKIVSFLLLILFLDSYSQNEYLDFVFDKSNISISMPDTVKFKVSLTALNGFNATANLSSSGSSMISPTSIAPPITGKICTLSVFPNGLISGENEITVTGKNGTTTLGEAKCTITVIPKVIVTPSLSLQKNYQDVGNFVIEITNSLKAEITDLNDSILIINTSKGSLSAETLDVRIDSVITLGVPSYDDFNIANVSFSNMNGDVLYDIACTTTVEYEWIFFNTHHDWDDIPNVLVADKENKIWVGCEGYYTGIGITCLNNGSWDVYTKSQIGINDNDVYSLVIDKKDNLWFGTDGRVHNDSSGNGIIKYDGMFWTIYDTSNSGLLSNKIKDLCVDTSDNIWIATHNGICIFNGTSWDTLSTSNSNLNSNEVNDIFIDQYNQKWFATNSGVSRYNGSEWHIYDNTNTPLPYENTPVNEVLVTKKGQIFFSTSFGLVSYNNNNWIIYDKTNAIDSLVHYNDPLIDVERMTEDNNGNVWLNTNYRLVRFDGYNWIIYPEDQIKMPDGKCLDNDGNMWCAIGSNKIGYYKAKDYSVNIKNSSNGGIKNKNITNPISIYNDKITYNISNRTNVKFEIYDLKGRQLTSINNGYKNPGTYSLKVDNIQLGSGVFIVKFISESEFYCSKMVLK